MIRTIPKTGQRSKNLRIRRSLRFCLDCVSSFPMWQYLYIQDLTMIIKRIWSYKLYRKCDRRHHPSGRVDAGLCSRPFSVPPWDRFRTDNYASSKREIWSSSSLPCLFPNIWPLHSRSLVLQFFCSPGRMPLLCWLLWRTKLGVSKVQTLLYL